MRRFTWRDREGARVNQSWINAVERLKEEKAALEAELKEKQKPVFDWPAPKVVANAFRDIEAYRGALGYTVPDVYDERLSNGEFPVNGIAQALGAQVATLEAEGKRLREALENIARQGVVFDAKGTHSKRVNEMAVAVLSSTPSLAAAVERVNPNVTGLVTPCQRCGRHPVRLDYIVSSEFWKQVVPHEWRPGVICWDCLDEISGGVPIREVKIAYLTGGDGTVALVPALDEGADHAD